MTQDRRLDKVKGSLTPKQAVILWLEEIRQYQNVYEYVRYLCGQPESAAPVTKLTERVDHAVREAMKGSPKLSVGVAVRRAVRDVIFLIKLHHQVNFKVLTEQRAWGLAVGMLAEMQNRMLTEGLLRDVVEGYCRQCQKCRRSRRPALDKLEKKVQGLRHWRMFAEAVLTELYAYQDSVASISRHYFDGHELLLQEPKECLAKLISELEKVVGMFNEMCTGKAELSHRLDIAEVRKGAARKATEQTAYLVDMAKADALDDLGEHKAARDIAIQHV